MDAPHGSQRWDWLMRQAKEAWHEGGELGPADPILEAAIRLGWITQQQGEEARAEQERLRGEGQEVPIEQALLRLRFLKADQVGRLVGLVQGLAQGTTLGRYEVKEELGRGGMGRVYRAYDRVMKRDVALKLVSVSDEGHERLEREARAAARLRHPGIVPVFDVGEEGSVRYLVMEYVPGRTLEGTWIAWSLRKRVQALERIAAAVAHAHQEGVIHRDLKPENVMVGESGEVRVMDFGLAAVEGESRLTLTGTVMGTPAYMSPEQVRGERVGVAADVYSLGVMLYEALTERVPFYGANVHDVYRRILTEEAVAPRRIDPRIPVDLEIVCIRAMDKEAPRRYPSVEAFAGELRRWLAGEPIQARPASRIYKLRKRIRKNPWAWAAISAACLVALLGAGGVGWMAQKKGREREAARLAGLAGVSFAAGDLGQARKFALQARDIVPSQPEAAYWLARLRLRDYQAGRPLPQVRIIRGLTEILPPPPETPELAAIRREVEKAFRGRMEGELALGILALWDGEYAKALEAFQKDIGESGPAQASHWEAAIWAAHAFFYLRRFDEARERLQGHLVVDARVVGPVWGALNLAQGMDARLRGRDFGPFFESAANTGDRIEAVGLAEAGKVLRARANVEWGKAGADLGQDPEERYAAALGWLEGLQTVPALEARGDALLARAEWRRDHGGLDLDAPEPYQEAIEAYTLAIEADPSYLPVLLKRAEAYRARWEFQSAVGRQQDRDVESAGADYERVAAANDDYGDAALGVAWMQGTLERGNLRDPERNVRGCERQAGGIGEILDVRPDYLPGLFERGAVRRQLGEFLQERGGGFETAYAGAIEDLSRATEIDGQYVAAWLELGMVYGDLAKARSDRGEDPRPEFERAWEAFSAALAANGASAKAHLALGLARIAHAECQNERGRATREDFERAIETLKEAARKNPLLPEAHAHLGRTRVLAARWEAAQGADPLPGLQAALADLSRAVELHRSSPLSYLGRGEARVELALYLAGQAQPFQAFLNDGMEDLRRASAIDPSQAEAWIARGRARQNYGYVLLRRGEDPLPEYEGGLGEFSRAIEASPFSTDAFLGRGTARFNIGVFRQSRGLDPTPDYEEAVRDYSRALDLKPSDARAYYLLGSAHFNMGAYRKSRHEDPTADYEAAIRDLTRSAELRQGFTAALSVRALVRQNLAEHIESSGGEASGTFREAVADFTQVVEVHQEDAEAWTNLGVAQQALAGSLRAAAARASTEESIASLTRALDLNPDRAEAHFYRGRGLLQLGRAREAVTDLERALDLGPALREWVAPLLDQARRESGLGPEF